MQSYEKKREIQKESLFFNTNQRDRYFITVEAYKTKDYSAVGFYARCHFTPAEPPIGYKDTLRMYKVLHPTILQEE